MASTTAPEPIRFGTVGSPLTAPQSGTAAAIEHTRMLGMDHLEIAWVQSVRVSDDTCAAIKAAGSQRQITLSIHAP
jgi:deoxyribonuclease-4